MSDRLLLGIGVSPGIAMGPARLVRWELPKVARRLVARERVEAEIRRLRDAVAAVRAQLEDFRAQTLRHAGAKEAQIFDAQILMLEDPEFLRDVETLIRENRLSAERAFEFKTLEMRALWSQSSNARLQQRVADLAGLQLRVLNQLMGRSLSAILETPDERPVVVFTRELTPGLLVQLERERVAGIATEEGTRVSHAAILARSLGMPCVMGLVGALSRITPEVNVILDGTHGAVLLDPTAEELEQAREWEQNRLRLAARVAAVLGEPAVTPDGHVVALRGNVDLPDDLEVARTHGAEGVGLLRTEFLLLGRPDMPSEEEQVAFFERAAAAFPDNPIVVRSYDVGGDKYPATYQLAAEPNPFLGWRAIRVCLDRPEFFRTQIRALARARCRGDLQLMLPLVTGIEELERSRELVAEALHDLATEGIPAASDLPLGVMVETPAAAVLVEELADRCDFLSVGTNDLTQYTLAVDRGNARLAGRFAPHHPAVLRLLKRIADAGREAGHAVSVCGEMGSDPKMVFVLLGLGYSVLSVAPSALPLIRWFVREVRRADATRVAQELLALRTVREVTAHLEAELGKLVDLDLIDAGRLPAGYGAATLNAHP